MADPRKGKNESRAQAELDELPPVVRVEPSDSEFRTATRITGGSLDVNLHGTAIPPTDVQAFWEVILRETEAISFKNYATFIDKTLCSDDDCVKGNYTRLKDLPRNPKFIGLDTYQLLRAATEAFLITQCGFLPSELGTGAIDSTRFGGTAPTDLVALLETYLVGDKNLLPYIERIATNLPKSDIAPLCGEVLLQPCLLELIWSYWHEEGLLVQAINSISLRFQNKRGPSEREPLANLETNPLRPLSNLLWGYIQDEDHRLTIPRRAYEYEHHYGLSLVGKAVPRLRPADRRSKFLEAFHALLREAAIFYDRSSNLTVRADGFPLLNALREVHLLLAEGAHNQFRDLPWTSRAEMLIQQYLLSRREMREFLGGRASVPYTEDWMGPVDAIKRLMGWNDTPVTHFHDLAVTGERILLSIRYHAWNDATNEAEATGWATYWKPEIQRYIHAYQAAVGVDLGALKDAPSTRAINATLPSVLLQQRNARQNGGR